MNFQEYNMVKSFATHSHVSSIRSVASNKNILASGGADDSVYLYDLHNRVEFGRLMHHNGRCDHIRSLFACHVKIRDEIIYFNMFYIFLYIYADTVNCIAFTPDASHLFSCSSDGTIAAIRCGNWQTEKHWQKPHKGSAVNTLAIHPTGKIALSTGADGILRTWNLVKGRQAYATNLVPRLRLDARNVNVLKWSPNGEKYLLAVNQRIDVYSVESAGIDNEIKFDSKIICVEFLNDDLIAAGLENGQIKFYDLEKSVEIVEVVAHVNRVKCMAFKDNLLITASNNGEIKLWRYRRRRLDMLQKVNCGVRITCLSLAMLC